MSSNPRCMYHNSFAAFLRDPELDVLGALHDSYHGDSCTTTTEAWEEAIQIMRDVISTCEDEGHVIFEYDIPRLGKQINVVLFLRIIFCIEFKVGESHILPADVDQVLDYALDLKDFHKFSRDRIIVPILVATNYPKTS